jgi:hypothetical protein
MKQVRFRNNKSVIIAEGKLVVGNDRGMMGAAPLLLLPGSHETSQRCRIESRLTEVREFQRGKLW